MREGIGLGMDRISRATRLSGGARISPQRNDEPARSERVGTRKSLLQGAAGPTPNASISARLDKTNSIRFNPN